MSNLSRFGTEILMGDRSYRKTAMTDKVKGLTIDTVYAPDVMKWETGIEKEKWIIVEEYEKEIEAKKGHEKWIGLIRKNPKMELEQCRTPEEWFNG